jgi:hypothetical protein
MPSRRTLASGILPFARSVLARFGILPALARKAGSIGIGNPAQSRDALDAPGAGETLPSQGVITAWPWPP